MTKKRKISIGRIILGVIFLIGGLITISTGIERMLHGLPFTLWLSIIAFGVATTLGGIGVLLGGEWEDVTSFLP
jgi:hypothetical protein